MLSKRCAYKLIGKQYEYTDENGKALGCFMPIYEVLEIPINNLRFDWQEKDKLAGYILQKLLEHCYDIEKPQYGDIALIKLPLNSGYHVAIYISEDELLHCMSTFGVEKVAEDAFKNRIERRMRWDEKLY
jgi:hypothetical protein